MSVQFSVLASSSAANCAVLASQSTRILIDAGLSRKACFERLAAVGVKPESLSFVAVTHAHLDHGGHANAIAKTLNIPVFTTEETAASLKLDCQVVKVTPGAFSMYCGVTACTFPTPHDIEGSVGFSFYMEDLKISIITDAGFISDEVARQLVGSNILMIESNYSCAMLKVGPYAWKLKERVMGNCGHLSNEAVAEFITQHLDQRTSTLIIGHLSSSNNHPAIAESMASRALAEKGLSPRLLIAKGKEPVSVLY